MKPSNGQLTLPPPSRPGNSLGAVADDGHAAEIWLQAIAKTASAQLTPYGGDLPSTSGKAAVVLRKCEHEPALDLVGAGRG